MNTPLVSIVCITYNHEPYLRQALDSFLMQETTFPVEIVLAEDCSSDGTRSICEEYAAKYPEKVHYIWSDENVGAIKNEQRAIAAAQGKYLAFCEGDDYWTDSQKLQRQVDWMEAHPDYSFCVTRFLKEESGKQEETYVVSKFIKGETSDKDISKDDFLAGWVTQYLTLLCRHDCYDNTLCEQYARFCDTHQVYYLLKCGKGSMLNFIGGVYRATGSGIYTSDDCYHQWQKTYVLYSELAKNTKDKAVRAYCTHILQDMLYWKVCPTKHERWQLCKKIFAETHNFVKLLKNIKLIFKQ